MKKLVILLIIMMVSSCVAPRGTPYMGPFSGKTVHKPIKRMTRHEIRKAQAGHSLYVRENGKVYRNNGREWTVFSKPRFKHSKRK